MGNNPLRVLIVEDDEVSRIVVQRFLVNNGYCVDTAVDGQKAMVQLGNEQYDVVLMDLVLPKIGGFNLAHQMKKHESTRCIPIIAISTSSFSSEEFDAYREDLDAFVGKPFRPEELLHTIHELTADHQPDLDWAGLLTRMDGELDFIKEVSDLFCVNSAKLISEIEESQDYDYIGELAHRLKGSAATAGALSLVELSARIQDASRRKNLNEIKSQCKHFPRLLEYYINSLASKGIKAEICQNKASSR